MQKPFTYEFSALYYLNWWLMYDSRFSRDFMGTQGAVKLSAIREAAAVYKVARNLKRKYDENKKKGKLPRFQPVLDAVHACKATDFIGKDALSSMKAVSGRISRAYGDSSTLSFTTKILWLRFKSPIIIYDGNARAVLGTPKGDLAEYYLAWRREFNKACVQIDTACKLLPDVVRFSISGHVRRDEVVELVSNDWFKERVFDVWLWHTGAKRPAIPMKL